MAEPVTVVVEPVPVSAPQQTTETATSVQVQMPTTSFLPVVDTTRLPIPQPGVATPLLSLPEPLPPLPAAGDWESEGAFRLACNWSRMSFDDPIVYPDRPGAAHHHTFFGNTEIDAFTTTDNIRGKGNSSCRGGTINLSGYWIPSMIDTVTNQPIAPRILLLYYKTGAWPYMADGSVMQPIPKGLKMLAGDPAAISSGGKGSFACMMPIGHDRAGTRGNSIPANCQPGDELWGQVDFPQCWDGRNLDSPDHKSHMAYPQSWPEYNSPVPGKPFRCPPSHPVVLPKITFQPIWTLPANGDTSKWRLASDAYDVSKPGGYSLHADWINGWDPVISELWGVKCLRERRNCGMAILGDGRRTLEFQGN